MMNIFSLVTAMAVFFSSLSSVVANEYPDKDSLRSLRGMKAPTAKPTMMKPKIYFSLLNPAQETPACPTSTALGNAILTYMDMKLCIRLSYTGLSDVELFSHIHGPAMIDATAGVLFTLGMDTNKVECFTLTTEQEGFLMAGMLYFNIHSEECPGGEIRGQIIMA